MATEKRTVYGSTSVLADGSLDVKLEKQIVEDGNVIFREPHRGVIHPGEDVAAVIAGMVANLASGVQLKSGEIAPFPVADDSDQRVKALAALEHTPERVAKFRKDKADRDERERGVKAARNIA